MVAILPVNQPGQVQLTQIGDRIFLIAFCNGGVNPMFEISLKEEGPDEDTRETNLKQEPPQKLRKVKPQICSSRYRIRFFSEIRYVLEAYLTS